MIEAAATLDGQWNATETELESLRQVSGDKKVVVRASEGRVEKLRWQLKRWVENTTVDAGIPKLVRRIYGSGHWLLISLG